MTFSTVNEQVLRSANSGFNLTILYTHQTITSSTDQLRISKKEQCLTL